MWRSKDIASWADNFMIVMGVDDAEAWHRLVLEIADSGEFRDVGVKPPETIGDSLVLHVIDLHGS